MSKRWTWMPHAAHLCVGASCRFHLATYVGGITVSTVGEYAPDSSVRKVLNESRGVVSVEFEEIGCGRLYESMAFKSKPSKEGACCPFVVTDWGGVDSAGYNDPVSAVKGHIEMCKKWSAWV